MELPLEFRQRMINLLGEEEFDEYEKSFFAVRKYGLRVNTRKISVEKFQEISPFEIKKVPWISNGFFYDGEKDSPGKTPILSCRIILSSGAKCDDSGRASACK